MKPNTGIIKSGKKVEVSINLEPIPSSVKDHKFMLQVARTSLLPEGLAADDLNQFWKNVKSLDSSAREDHKLKVVLISSNVVSSTVVEESKKVESVNKEELGDGLNSSSIQVETIIEEIKEVDDGVKSEYVGKIAQMEQKYSDLQKEIEAKEKELKELKEKESQDDNKAFGRRSAASEFRRRSNAVKKPENPFHMMHLLIAIFAGLGLGILIPNLL